MKNENLQKSGKGGKIKRMKTLSLIVPCYNEEANVEPFYKAASSVIDQMNEPIKTASQKIQMELVFVNDGSKDKTLEKISSLNKKDKRVKCVSFARNFGKEAALFAGIRAATGNCAVILDADLQHPVEVIKEMYAKWLEGFEVVEGIKISRGKESVFHKMSAGIFYAMISKAVGMNMRDSSDYKLLDRKVLDELSKLKERNTFFRALSFWMGFKKTVVHYEVHERNFGVSKWSTKSLMRYALNNVVCFSYAPLQLVTLLGALFIILGLCFAVDALISHVKGVAASGFPTLVVLLLFGFGGIMVSLGIIGVYIAQIYDEVKARPQYIVGEKIGF